MDKKETELNFLFWAMAAHGDGVSGGDRIFIEFAREWVSKHPITIYVGKQGLEMANRLSLGSAVKFETLGWDKKTSFNFLLFYLSRILAATLRSLQGFNQIQMKKDQHTILYSTSDFLMDVIPCLILKLRFPKATWIASWYQSAPNPFQGYSEGERKNRYRLNVLLLWLSQQLTKPLIHYFADMVLVNNEGEKKVFPKHNTKNLVWVVYGGVDINQINEWKKSNKPLEKKYDAVFQGRFHPQKGVIELIEIWQKVVSQKPDAKLTMIGDGPLMADVKNKIKELHLEQNITLLGYVYDGPKKYTIFSESKIIVHPAFFDSGGMAAAEAMAFGLPCIGFNLKSYESYYPQGMIKVEIGNNEAFANEIVKLLENKSEREKIGLQAKEMVNQSWSWSKRSENILSQLKKFISA